MNKNRRFSIIFGIITILFIIGLSTLEQITESSLSIAWQGGLVFSVIAVFFGIRSVKTKEKKAKTFTGS
ncbi:MAG: hypothetical protein ABF649_19285 [Bacillus sp. (in: firmicutes)]